MFFYLTSFIWGDLFYYKRINLQLTIVREHARPLGNLVLLFFFQEKNSQNYLLLCFVVFVLARLHCIVIRELIMSLLKICFLVTSSESWLFSYVSYSNICTVF